MPTSMLVPDVPRSADHQFCSFRKVLSYKSLTFIFLEKSAITAPALANGDGVPCGHEPSLSDSIMGLFFCVVKKISQFIDD